MKILIMLLIFLCEINVQVESVAVGVINRIYLDKTKNIHVVAKNGQDIKITKGGRIANATLSPDKRTVAWMKLNKWIAEGDTEPQASVLGIYKNGKIRYIECGPFIRDYWFWMQGKQVATDCGGRHFAGTLTLYDTDSLKEIESIFQMDVSEEKLPAWAKPGSH